MKNIFRFIIILFLFSTKINSQSFGGTLTTNATVCAGNNNGVLSVSGYSGSIVRWEYSYSSTGPWTPMVYTSNSYNYINLGQSTYFKVIVQMLGYAEASSNSVLITCNPMSVAGNISSNTVQCINSPVSFTLSANTGSVLSWEYSTTNWLISNTITTSNTLIASLSNLSTTTQVRVSVKNGVCPAVFSSPVTIVPASASVGGTISGNSNACAISNTSTLSLNNFTGAIQYWESSNSSGGPFNMITNTTPSLAYTNLNQDTWYRAVVKNSTCPSTVSSVFFVNVDQASVGGSIVGTQTACAQINNGTLQLISNTGSVLNWESSSNAGSTWNTISNTNNNQIFSNLSSTNVYRALVQNGICPSVYSATSSVVVYPKPIVSFNANSSCVQSIVNFTNSSSAANLYVWDFGDGTSANINATSHIYTSAGSFTIKLIATSTQNCIDSVKQTLLIHPKPNAGFVNADTACFGTSILFSNSSTISSGSINQIKFDFNDGTTSTTVNPVTHNFLTAGSFTVSLKVTSTMGCRDSTNKLISIYPKPKAEFYASNVCFGSPVLFNNQSSISSGVLNNSWSFGNSFNSNLNSPQFVYPNAGTYTVSLLTLSNHNCADTVFHTLSVNEKATIHLTATNACLGSSAQFTTTYATSQSNSTLNLSFGDGSSSTTGNASHTYFSSGIFVASVTAVTDSGCVSSDFENVMIYAKPFANFNFTNACSGDSVLFNNTSSISNGNLSYNWQLNNTYTSSTASPKYLYPNSGNYTITLIAKNEYNCSDTSIKVLTSYEAPKANFMFKSPCDGFPVTFSNTSSIGSGGISNYVWQFGDNSSSMEINPKKTYLNQGTYNVLLIATSNEGCSDTVKKTLNIYEGPIADFLANAACFNEANLFQNQSLLKEGTYNSFWKFEDNETSDANSPQHKFSKPGIHQVSLKVISNNNCVDSVSHFVESLSLPKVTVSRDTSVQKGFGIYLQASGALNYQWNPAIYLNDPTIAKPLVNPQSNITYIVEGTDKYGCKNSDTININVMDEFLVIPYNVLTPNDFNGKNDTWIVKNIETYPQNEVLIFDQWNQTVFEKQGYDNEWDGKNMRGEILPDGTYYYILKFKENPKTYSGYITLMRNTGN